MMESTTTLNPKTLLDLSIDQANIKICSRCIYDERVASINFDENGVCNYCHQVDRLTEQYCTGAAKGIATFEKILDDVRASGKNKKYDCVIGVSGGTDSSYLCYLARRYGLRPLAVHYDNTWNSAIATMNIHKVLKSLDIDLYTHVVDNKEVDDIFRSFFFAGVAEIEASTDLGFAQVLRQAAAQHKIRYIFEGHSFVAEGITPLGRNYFDGRYIQAIHQKYGTRPMKTYPLMTFSRFLKSAIIDRVKFIRPLWYLDYAKEDAKVLLRREYGWEYYGGHHLENRMTAFFHSVYAPQKFQSDFRNNTLSAQVRCGSKSRQDAWTEYKSPPHVEHELVAYFKKRLNLSDETYNEIMGLAPKSWTDFPTYKKRFERLRPVFFLLAKANLVPMSFYLKYCFPIRVAG